MTDPRRHGAGPAPRGWRRPLARWLAVLPLLAAVAGCSSLPFIGPALLLARADRQAQEGAWQEAVETYDRFLARFPEDSAAPRALETRDTLAATLTAQAELARRREEVARLRDELAGLQDEGVRLRVEGTRLRGDATVLRDEVIRLRDERSMLRQERLQLREETAQLREQLNRREGNLARTRQELAAQQAEAERLRSDIERLKQVDLKLERKR